MPEDIDTIYALSSGTLPAGIAVVRVSGVKARFAIETMIGDVPKPRAATLADLRGEDGAVLDRGMVIFFPAPASFTGEDVVELHLHGGMAVVAAVLAELGSFDGFRAAEAGEFTRRAFANGKLDLIQVEGLADLIVAETEAQRRQALRQADGTTTAVLDGWRGRLIRARAMLEAELDFADEEDVPGSVSVSAWQDVDDVRQEIVNHVSTKAGERIRDGIDIVVMGAPNAGKSSLVNALAQRDVAIVSAEEGTTRDLIEVRLDLDGVPVTLVDTAGLREATGSEVEGEGMRRARARAERAEMALWLVDVTLESGQWTVGGPFEGAAVTVGTKIDMIDSDTERSAAGVFDVTISTRTGAGMTRLIDRIADEASRLTAVGSPALVTRQRHREALTVCAAEIESAVKGTAEPLEVRAEYLRRAADALGRITGKVDVDDLLDVIFRDFCIGK